MAQPDGARRFRFRLPSALLTIAFTLPSVVPEPARAQRVPAAPADTVVLLAPIGCLSAPKTRHMPAGWCSCAAIASRLWVRVMGDRARGCASCRTARGDADARHDRGSHPPVLAPVQRDPWNDQVLRESLSLRTARAVNHARATLRAGFTTARDLGTEGAGFADHGLRQAIEQGVIPGPRLLIASKAIVASGSYGPDGFCERVGGAAGSRRSRRRRRT